MTEGFSPAKVLYSDRDSRQMRRRRGFFLAAVIGATAVIIGGLTAALLGVIVAAWSNGALTLEVVLAWIAAELILVLGAFYAFVYSALDDLRHGFTVTADTVRFSGMMISITSILRAEIVRFTGHPDCLAIDHRGRWFRKEWVWTTLVPREGAENLERLRDAIRTAMGLPPQTFVTESTWREWRRTAVAPPRRSANP